MTLDDMTLDIDGKELWSTAWAGGRALARYVFEHPDAVNGLRVADLACGSGIVGIAAAMCGAASVLAVDVEPKALTATYNNAAANGLASRFETSLTLTDDWDVLLVGDAMSYLAIRHILSRIPPGRTVLVAEPGRRGLADFNMNMRDKTLLPLVTYRMGTIPEEADHSDLVQPTVYIVA